jgi:hypothetical protein
LPRIPKLFIPSVACPSCSYANDETFRFCQQCGVGEEQSVTKLPVREDVISKRLEQLAQQRQSSSYVRQKSALERELASFLASVSSPRSLATASPTDVISFLVWKDRGGRTRVHGPDCSASGIRATRAVACHCPKRLAYGTVDSLIGKLRAIFAENGRGSE